MATVDKIKKIIAEQLNKDINEIGEDMDIVKDLGADSLDIVEMIMNIEEEFGITVEDDKAVNVKTVKDIVSLLEK
ncbi:MAG: acyl carrier protein [Firmicutes bacterium]|nr:acyl carrier protein [Candidatus Caballimonas caccae]